MSDSDHDLFLTQSSFRDVSCCEADTDEVLSGVIDMEKEYVPCFNIKNDLFSDISSDDGLLVQASMDMENSDIKSNGKESTRFLSPLKEKDLQSLLSEGKCKQTENKARWAVNLFYKWQNQRANKDCEQNFSKPLMEMEPEEMSDAMCFFITEVRNEAGKEYRPNTIYEIIVSIQHFLRSSGKLVSFLDDEVYSKMKSILNAKMKNLSKQGLGLERKQAEIITVQQEKLWSMGILGSDTPQKLFTTMIYLNGLHFALRAGKEQRNLRYGPLSQIKLMQDSDGRKYLQYTEDISKTNSGGLSHRKVTPKMTRGYESSNKGRCIVQLYMKYIQARPVTAKTDAFYLRPKATITGSYWYIDAPVGVHTLQETVKKLCEEAGFSGHFTNHSLRATAATRLYSAGVDEQLIAEKTGHRSNAVRLYKRTSDEQQQKMSEILRGEQKENERCGVKKQKTSGNATCATDTVTGGKEITCNIKDGVVNINVKFE